MAVARILAGVFRTFLVKVDLMFMETKAPGENYAIFNEVLEH